MLRFTTLLLVLSGAALSTNQETFRLSFGQKGLDWFETVVATVNDILRDVIMSGLVIPPMDMNGVEVDNLKMRDLDLPKPDLSIVPGTGYKLNANGLNMVIDGEWAFGFLGGDLTVNTKLNLEAIARVDADMENGKFRTSAKACDVDFVSLEIDMGNELLNTIAEGMVEDVKGEIAGIVCKEVNTALDTGINSLLLAIPSEVKLHLLQDIVFTFAPDSDPIYSADHVDVPCRVHAKSKVPFPFAPQGITDSLDPEFIGCVLLSDYLVNSVSFLALGKGKIRESIPNKKFPIGSDLTNTAYFKKSLPQLYNKYPNKDVTYTITNTRFPKLEFDKGLQMIDVPLRVLVKVDGATIINLKLSLKTRGDLAIRGTKITGTCEEIKTKTVVVSSKIGDIDADVANDIMDDIFLKTIIPDVNAFFKKGFNLPCVDKVITTKRALAQTHDDYLRVCGDFALTDYTLDVVRTEIEKIVANFTFDF